MNDFNRGQQHARLQQEQEGPSWRVVNELRAENERLREKLGWYARMVSDYPKLGLVGDLARHALDADRGARGIAALANHEQEPDDEKRS